MPPSSSGCCWKTFQTAKEQQNGQISPQFSTENRAKRGRFFQNKNASQSAADSFHPLDTHLKQETGTLKPNTPGTSGQTLLWRIFVFNLFKIWEKKWVGEYGRNVFVLFFRSSKEKRSDWFPLSCREEEECWNRRFLPCTFKILSNKMQLNSLSFCPVK